MSTREHVIDITGMTVLQIGGCRITIEPTAGGERNAAVPALLAGTSRDSTPREWRIAEAELQKKTHSPFEPHSPSEPPAKTEPPARSKVERLSFMPRAGGNFRTIGGGSVEIAQVVGRDGSVWIVLDSRGRPFALRRIDLAWHALPPNPSPPMHGDVILHHGANSTVAEVLGKAEIGGWAVKNNAGVSVHVLRGEVGRWMSLGRVEIAE